MAALTWDETGKHFYDTGLDRGVLYVWDPTASKYAKGVAWSGLTKVTDKPTGAEITKLYADNIPYLSMISAEEFEETIEAYTFPDEFFACDGVVDQKGVRMGQQARRSFCLSYRTIRGNDTDGNAHGETLHIRYGLLASPSEKARETVNSSPTATTFSWSCKSTPISATDLKPVSSLEVSSDSVKPKAFKALKDRLWGSASDEPTLLLPDEVTALIETNSTP